MQQNNLMENGWKAILINLKDMRIPSIRVERYEGEELTKLQKKLWL